jgi:hypothetical protein
MFKAAQKILAEGKSKNAPKPTNEYLLGRRIRCACGFATMCRTHTTLPFGKKYSYYLCMRRHGSLTNPIECDIPTIRVEILDTKVWERIERFLRDPHEQRETLKRVQSDLVEQHKEAIERMRECEATREEYKRRISIYSDQEVEGLISREMFKEKKAELDKRLQAAEEVYSEYEQLLANKLLSDQDIEDMLLDLQNLQAELEQLGELPFEKRRALIEAMHITGKMKIEEGEHVLYLFVYNTKVDTILLQERATPAR